MSKRKLVSSSNEKEGVDLPRVDDDVVQTEKPHKSFIELNKVRSYETHSQK